jgi:hypothetical protein
MGIGINTKPFDINAFWNKTPTALKYITLIAVIVAASYFLFSRKVDVSQIKELTKIEQGIEVTYQLVDKFEAFQKFQTQYNDQVIKDIRNIYTLVTELNDNVNRKFNYLINNSGKYNQDLIDKMDLLNESFDKLSKAYQPTGETKTDIELPKYEIGVKKIDENKNDK